MRTKRSLLTAAIAAGVGVVTATGPAVAVGATPAVTVQVDSANSLAELRAGAIGVNTPVWNPAVPDPRTPALVRAAGVGTLEFNGGPISDLYHFRDGSLSPDPEPEARSFPYADLPPQFSFDEFERLAHRTGARTIVHVNYGTGTPAEAAAWVRYANKVRHDGVRDWVVGEEVWGNGGIPNVDFEPDAHTDKSPAAYAKNALKFMSAMKSADPHIRVGVEVTGLPTGPFHDWDVAVLKIVGSAADFVDFHAYPFKPAGIPDATLLTLPRGIPADVGALRRLVDTYASTKVDLVAGETNSGVFQAPQQISMANALYLPDDMLSLLESGARNADWWALYNGGYGQTHGDLGLLSTGDCSDDNTVCAPPAGTPFPPYHAMELLGRMTGHGGRLVPVTSDDPLVVGHAVRRPDDTLAVLLENENATSAVRVRLGTGGYRTASVLRYADGDTAVHTTRDLGTLPAYSLTLVLLVK